jgi:alanine dehydrogenase
VILGAGVLGSSAARAFAGLGAHVTILDTDVRRLRALEHQLGGGVAYLHASDVTVSRSVAYADVVLGAVLVPGERAPVLVAKQAVQEMRPGAVLLDLSIDQGGCFESSRPTTLADPVFRAHGAIHYCAPNTPALVARTASHALSHEIAPLLATRFERLADVLRPAHPLSTAVAFYRGMPVRQTLARALGLEAASLDAALVRSDVRGKH